MSEYQSSLALIRIQLHFRSPSVGPGDLEVVQEIQVSADPDERGNDAAVREGQVSIISTYESGQAKQVAFISGVY